MWPDQIADLDKDSYTLQECYGWQVVPDNFDDLSDWAYLAKNEHATDKKHAHHLLYVVPKGNIQLYVVTLRLQGFVARRSLTPLGDWNGQVFPHTIQAVILRDKKKNLPRDPDSVQTAVQYISLTSGGFTAQWAATHQAIKNIRQLCHNSLPGAETFIEPDVDPNSDLYVRRRVFIKVMWIKFIKKNDAHNTIRRCPKMA